MRFLAFSLFFFYFLLGSGNLCLSQDEKAQVVGAYLDKFEEFEYLDWQLAKVYLDSALTASEGTTDQELLGDLDLNQGWYFQDIGEFDTSRAFFFSALDHYVKANSYGQIADIYGNIGNAFLDIGDLKNALDYQMMSLKTHEKILLLSEEPEMRDEAKRGQAYAWANIASIYNSVGDYEHSLLYQYQALEYDLTQDDSVSLGITYIGLSTTYENLNDMDSSDRYLYLAHGIFKRHNYSNGLINSYINLYRSDRIQGKLTVEYLEEALDVCRDFEDTFSELYILGHLLREDFGYSRDSLDKIVDRGLMIIEEFELEETMYDFYQAQAIYYDRSNRSKQAYDALYKYFELFRDREKSSEGIDFENTQLKHNFELQSLEDSLTFEQTLADEKLKNEKVIGRQRTITAITILGLLVLAIILIFVYRALKVKKRNNIALQDKNLQIERQKELVEEKNTEITASITYAKRLQNAILPPLEVLDEHFSDSFVLYQPKDVVSGDFYWFEKKDDIVFVAAADCTGHGVPGAMVSVVCSNALNRTVNEFGLTSTAEILNKTRELVISTFAKSGEDVKDGMDISICAVHRNTGKMCFSGANNPLWIVRKNDSLSKSQLEDKTTYLGKEFSLIELKGDKQPVGRYATMQDFTFTEISLEPEDRIYLFTDGYADQFGGDKGKKLKYRNFKRIIVENSHESFSVQGEKLNEFMSKWMGELEQVDDICVIGLQIA